MNRITHSTKGLALLAVTIVSCLVTPAIAQPAAPQFAPSWGWPNGDFNGHWDGINNNAWHTPGSSSYWNISGGITNNLVIANVFDAGQNNELWFQFDYQINSGGLILLGVLGDADSSDPWSGVSRHQVDGLWSAADLGGGWTRAWFQYEFDNQPAREQVMFVLVNSSVANVYFSTAHIPEPGTMTLAALGLAGLAFRTRRHSGK